jgi:hypothetical protein
MDRLSIIELKIAEVLENIDGTTQPNTYKYYTKTGQVNIDDEAICFGIGMSQDDLNVVDYIIEQDPNESNEEYGMGQNAYTNNIMYRITARVKNLTDSDSPTHTIKERCNETLSDLKYAFAINQTLSNNVNWIRYESSTRQYNPTNDIIRTADLYVNFSVNYGQAYTNPDLPACN